MVDAHLGACFNGWLYDVDGDFESAEALVAVAVFDLVANFIGLEDDGVEAVVAGAPSAGRWLDLVDRTDLHHTTVEGDDIYEASPLSLPVTGAEVGDQDGMMDARAEDDEVAVAESRDVNAGGVAVGDAELVRIRVWFGDGAGREFGRRCVGVDGWIDGNGEGLAAFKDVVDLGC